MLGEAGLSDEGKNGTAWRRLVVEKPFGRDLESAVDLNHTIEKHFAEHQVYRIDHYLAKETVQNVLCVAFRQFHIRAHLEQAIYRERSYKRYRVTRSGKPCTLL